MICNAPFCDVAFQVVALELLKQLLHSGADLGCTGEDRG